MGEFGILDIIVDGVIYARVRSNIQRTMVLSFIFSILHPFQTNDKNYCFVSLIDNKSNGPICLFNDDDRKSKNELNSHPGFFKDGTLCNMFTKSLIMNSMVFKLFID